MSLAFEDVQYAVKILKEDDMICRCDIHEKIARIISFKGDEFEVEISSLGNDPTVVIYNCDKDVESLIIDVSSDNVVDKLKDFFDGR